MLKKAIKNYSPAFTQHFWEPEKKFGSHSIFYQCYKSSTAAKCTVAIKFLSSGLWKSLCLIERHSSEFYSLPFVRFFANIMVNYESQNDQHYRPFCVQHSTTTQYKYYISLQKWHEWITKHLNSTLPLWCCQTWPNNWGKINCFKND